MPLELRPMTAADAESWMRIREEAYAGPTHSLLFTRSLIKASLQARARDREPEIGGPRMWHWKVVDTELPPSSDEPDDNNGRNIAIAVWSLHNVPKREGEADPVLVHAPPAEVRLDALKSKIGPMRVVRDEIMGTEKPFLMLNMFATLPEHQGRGAGTMLITWGLEKADEEGLVIYLDSSEAARPIYEKKGFKVARDMWWDRVPWGGEGRSWTGSMLRQPRLN
ncbi:hypothetical protein ACN47E_009372 [Coniothyrium glycines]